MSDLRCYVCGKPLKKIFYLCNMAQGVDRVFVVDEKCFPRTQPDAVVHVKVERLYEA